MAKESKELTPMMKQFFDLKAKHPDDIKMYYHETQERTMNCAFTSTKAY